MIVEKYYSRQFFCVQPRGIICVESALFHYGYSDFSPRKWSVAVPRTASRTVKRVQEIPLKPYFIQKNFLNLGKTIDNFNGIFLAVYDRERTLCDCFKYRTKLDNEICASRMAGRERNFMGDEQDSEGRSLSLHGRGA